MLPKSNLQNMFVLKVCSLALHFKNVCCNSQSKTHRSMWINHGGYTSTEPALSMLWPSVRDGISCESIFYVMTFQVLMFEDK